MVLLGAHMSVAGGLHRAFDHIRKVEGQALQIFTRNQRQWRAAPISTEEQRLWLKAWEQAASMVVASHASYLINLASPKQEVAEKSVTALADELGRCTALAIPMVVLHPGSHLGGGAAAGIERCAANLDAAFEAAANAGEVMVLLETTAGQGSCLGADFDELASIITLSRYPERIAVCLDTCHVFAAGHDLRTAAAYAATMATFEAQIGLARLRLVHLNDSERELGSRVDRHTHIGQGKIGVEAFRLLLNDPRLAGLPMLLETPKSDDLREDMGNLVLLNSLIE